ncbi:DUF1801 domain-containing protein [Parasphingorhabdus litoris]|uniref:DUF1801 domain-containing protein n=1 Tax=Parasphingorhabdus litoris TaxID=394733 RepID=A0ABP3KC12_9SPHN|nr:DUF1801 domain-containing protein [Parasphingorhabdus litoris]
MNANIPSQIQSVFDSYSETAQDRLKQLRSLIFEVAAHDDRIGPLEETLKWGQPSYLPSSSKSGTTIRIDANAKTAGNCALYVHCGTDLVARWRELYGEILHFEGNRAVIFEADKPLPTEAVKHIMAMALTYHLRS